MTKDRVEALTGCYLALELFEGYFNEYREFTKEENYSIISKSQKQRFFIVDNEYKRIKEELRKLSPRDEMAFGFTADYFQELMLEISRKAEGSFDLPNRVLEFVKSINDDKDGGEDNVSVSEGVH